MKTHTLASTAVLLLVLSCAQSQRNDIRINEDPQFVLDGLYIGEAFSIRIDGEAATLIAPDETTVQTRVLVKGDLVYIAPIVPDGQRMIRNVWIAYRIHDDRLESSHLEDMDDGQVFYSGEHPKITLFRQP